MFFPSTATSPEMVWEAGNAIMQDVYQTDNDIWVYTLWC